MRLIEGLSDDMNEEWVELFITYYSIEEDMIKDLLDISLIKNAITQHAVLL